LALDGGAVCSCLFSKNANDFAPRRSFRSCGQIFGQVRYLGKRRTGGANPAPDTAIR
jgi:hypothetical protein